MARKPRLHLPGGFYHVILRGNARRSIFHDTADRLLWQHFVRDGLDTCQHRIHAFCWMTNHIHMIVQAGNLPLAGFIGTLASRYARAYNKKYARSGHLFERRYRAPLVATDGYLLELVRYIHQNPLRANMVESISEYPWSSHHAYAANRAQDFLCTRVVLSMINAEVGAARRQYAEFVNETPSSDVVERLRAGEGESESTSLEGPLFQTAKPDTSKICGESLEQLIERFCRVHKVSEAELCSRSRIRRYADLRAEIALEAFDSDIATVTEVAERFRRSQPALSRAMNRLRRQRNKL